MPSLFCIAHRGGPIIGDRVSPENSLEAIQRSLDLGVDAIEIDIWYIAGELWVAHDRRLGRTLPGQGLLKHQSLDQLRQLRLANGEPIPSLNDVLKVVGNRALLNIEIKGPDCVSPLINTLAGFAHDHQVSMEQYLISSFDHQQLYQMLQQAPEIKRGVLIDGIPLNYAQICDALKAYSFNTGLSFLSRDLINDARQRGLKNWVYTVNHVEDWQWMLELGVDGVFTDKPADLLAFNASESRTEY